MCIALSSSLCLFVLRARFARTSVVVVSSFPFDSVCVFKCCALIGPPTIAFNVRRVHCQRDKRVPLHSSASIYDFELRTCHCDAKWRKKTNKPKFTCKRYARDSQMIWQAAEAEEKRNVTATKNALTRAHINVEQFIQRYGNIHCHVHYTTQIWWNVCFQRGIRIDSTRIMLQHLFLSLSTARVQFFLVRRTEKRKQ